MRSDQHTPQPFSLSTNCVLCSTFWSGPQHFYIANSNICQVLFGCRQEWNRPKNLEVRAFCRVNCSWEVACMWTTVMVSVWAGKVGLHEMKNTEWPVPLLPAAASSQPWAPFLLWRMSLAVVPLGIGWFIAITFSMRKIYAHKTLQ